MVINDVDLMTISAVDASRYTIKVARVLFSKEELINGCLADYRGLRDGKVIINDEKIKTIKGAEKPQ
ncbi:unnamed protein product [Didymodactylos carnosus]|uniref:Uncharacterized protein n=1 Tax=Didymodactylos carnosus TaxID=1234261 RepID=A0A815HVS7_9BILA|nr:unnamed protein product [Didymodactylos carnosus]CAF4232230.1 unnamed protein product [Didymodactylos carnosus]